MEDAPYIDVEPSDTATASVSHSYALGRLSNWLRNPKAIADETRNHPSRKAILKAMEVIKELASEQTGLRWVLPCMIGGIEIGVPGDVVHRIDRQGVVDVVRFAGSATTE